MNRFQKFANIAIVFVFAALSIVFSAASASASSDLATGYIIGTVCTDSNNSGVCEMNEMPKSDTPVYLQRVGEEVVGAMVAVAHTDSDGVFEFRNLEEGEYKIFAEEGEYMVVVVEGVNASAAIELAYPTQMFRMFLPMAVNQ